MRFPIGTKRVVKSEANPHVVNGIAGTEVTIVGYMPDDDGTPFYVVKLPNGKQTYVFHYQFEREST